MFPFKETKTTNPNVVIREFSPDTISEDLIWHRDREDRILEIIEPGNWWFQFDNEIPIALKKKTKLFIKAKTWHRVIKRGNKPLIVRVFKS